MKGLTTLQRPFSIVDSLRLIVLCDGGAAGLGSSGADVCIVEYSDVNSLSAQRVEIYRSSGVCLCFVLGLCFRCGVTTDYVPLKHSQL